MRDTCTRFSDYILTDRQKNFSSNFLENYHKYECWDEIEIGDSQILKKTFTIKTEDVIAFNKSCLEVDDRFFSAEGAFIHPIFYVMISFYGTGDGDMIGSWIRTPGAQNPGQEVEFLEPLEIGDIISTRITHYDKWVKRGKYYMQDLVEMTDQNGVLKVRAYGTLILPHSREKMEYFAKI